MPPTFWIDSLGDASILTAIGNSGRTMELSQWLVANGALSNGDDEIDDRIRETMCFLIRDRGCYSDVWPKLLSWAHNNVTTHASMKLFHMGTLSISSCYYSRNQDQRVTRSSSNNDRKRRKLASSLSVSSSSSSSSLVIFNGKSGILKLIGDFAGTLKPKTVRTLRQFVDLVSALMKE